MKKFLFKAVLVLGSVFLCQAAVAQSSYFEDSSSNDVTGDTLDYWVAIGADHQIYFDQINTSGQTITYKVQKTNTIISPTATTWFAVYHNGDQFDLQSLCYAPSTALSFSMITDSSSFNRLWCYFSAGTSPGITIVKYKFFDVNNTNDSATIWLRYNVALTGIAESHSATLGEPYPNPTSANFSAIFNFSHDNGGNAEVTDLSGKVIFTQALAAKNGILNIETSSWAKGVYILSLTDENGIAARRKIVVQ